MTSAATPGLTPARARELAAAVEALAGQVEAAHAALCVDVDEHRRRAGFRLEDAAGECRRVAAELHATASDLARLAAIPADACRVPFLVCPEHGNTVTSTGGQSWCRRCDRRWPHSYDEPCRELVSHSVTDTEGAVFAVCDGHAIDVRGRLVGGVVTPLAPRSAR